MAAEAVERTRGPRLLVILIMVVSLGFDLDLAGNEVLEPQDQFPPPDLGLRGGQTAPDLCDLVGDRHLAKGEAVAQASIISTKRRWTVRSSFAYACRRRMLYLGSRNMSDVTSSSAALVLV